MDKIKKLISEKPFFRDLKSEYIDILAKYATKSEYQPFDFIFKIGEDANNFYLVESGNVAIELFSSEKGIIRIQTVGEGDILGWSWMLPPYKWHFEARTIENTSLIVFDGKAILKECEKNQGFGYEILKRYMVVMAERLEAARYQLLDVYGN